MKFIIVNLPLRSAAGPHKSREQGIENYMGPKTGKFENPTPRSVALLYVFDRESFIEKLEKKRIR